MSIAADSRSGQFRERAAPGTEEYRERVAIPTMQAVDAMPPEFQACVHDHGYVDVYRAWRRGWTPDMIRAGAARNGGRFVL